MRYSDRNHSRAGALGLCALATLTLTACGGGGGSSGSGGTTTPPPATTYTIGGSVSGLASSGLVLTDNGGDNLSVPSGATSFTFSQALASGAQYDVAVATQPSGETCTVSSASGTVSGKVTTVSVTCAAPSTYTVGGTISGLTSSGLILQLNGANNLSVASGATTFTFPTALAPGASYAVTEEQPPNGESCTITAGSGTSTVNVTSVKVACSVVSAAYSISGNISGLATSGLHLQFYATGQRLSVTAGSTTYTYPGVPTGTDVAMDVITPLEWQVCAPNSGNYSGPINANLTNQNLACAAVSSNVTTFAGSGGAGSSDGTGTSASFNGPAGVAVDSAGNVYVADANNNSIREISPAGVVTTFAGSSSGAKYFASFNLPAGVAVDSAGNVYVADTFDNEIRKITPSGTVTTLAGSTTPGSTNGTGASAQFNGPEGVAVNAAGDVYVADTGNNEIREITPAGVVTTLAGSTAPGSADGTGSAASFYQPAGIAVDASGDIYVADHGNNEIREVTPAGVVTTLAGSTTSGSADGTGAAASFDFPQAVAVDAAGNVYVADAGNNEIRIISANGIVTTLAGSTTPGSANGTGTVAQFNNPSGVALNASGDVYVGDFNNDEVRKIAP